jgi:hypothetical protein
LFSEKIDQISVVSPNFRGVVPSFQVVAENFQSMDDSEEFLIMDFIIPFSRLE